MGNTLRLVAHQTLEAFISITNSFFGIVNFAVVTAHYQFLYVHVGSQGRISDGGAFK
jgi:hypothetical protein